MEPAETKMKSPRSVWFIMCDELCERFNYYGLRTVLVLYLTTILNYSEDYATIVYHGFIFISYFMPMFGAILSDSYWGKFKTIIRLSLVYALGNITLTGASMATGFTLDSQRCIAIIGLLLIAIGTGGIKPCTYTFGGDQFQLPEQQDQLATFFSRFITSIYIGSLVSTFLTPELRKSVQCFDRDSCFPLAFGMLATLMITAIAVFIFGRKLYVIRKPKNNVISKTFGCIFYAVRKKICSPKSKTDHWLDHAKNNYSEIEVTDTKAVLDALCIFMTYPVFWALYEQQGSRWTLQATLMDGKFQSTDWEIKPDQMQTINPLFALFFNLSLNLILYPFLAKFRIRKPLQRLVFSCFMAALAFFFTAILQLKIFGESSVIPANQGQFVIYNGFDCNVHVNSPLLDKNNSIDPLGSINIWYEPFSDEEIVNLTLKFDSTCGRSYSINDEKLQTYVTVSKAQSISYFLTPNSHKKVVLRRINGYDDFTKPKNGHPILRILISDDITKSESFSLAKMGKKSFVTYESVSFSNENFKQFALGNYSLIHGEKVVSSNINLMPATIYTLVIRNTSHSNEMESKLYATDKGNYLHILWQTPQYLCMIIADVIFIATTIEFSYTEAPVRMKSYVSACYSMTQAIGNLIVVVVSAFSFHKQVHEYLFFSGFMVANTLLLVYLSLNYKHKSFKQLINDDDDEKIAEENRSMVQMNMN